MKKNDLTQLIKKSWISIGRKTDMCWMKFGTEEDKVNQTYFLLYLYCPWRVSKGKKILLSNYDIYEAIPSYGDWEKVNMFDKKIERFFDKGSIIIENISLSEVNDLTLYLSNNVTIECFVNDLKRENWRFFHLGNSTNFVVMGNGIKIV